MTMLSILRHVELIYEHIKYKLDVRNDSHRSLYPSFSLTSLQVTQCGPTSFFVVLNDSHVELEAHRMNDGGILINLNGSSYLTFMKEEVDSYRIVVNNKSCVFQKENDPSILRFDLAVP
jgi:hypothetical protein